ncbi:pyridoxal phosphate-dependent aminotransferase [Desulfurococcaceae archaeon AG1]|nr:pyridoxal phosphate-dependent aminotransferase [Desulfurococcaceae archaeon AG1]
MYHLARNSPIDGAKSIVKDLKGELGFAYIARARALREKGHRVISFGVGQPDIPTFDHIVESAKKALDKRITGYTETQGIPRLRRAFADYLNERYGADVKEDEVIVTTGAKTAIFLAMASYISPGDEVIIPEPSYPAYGEVARFLGGVPKYVPLRFKGSSGGFELDANSIASMVTEKTKMIVINNPHNPTGYVFPPKTLEEIYRIAQENGLLILADEIYDNFVYGETPFRSMTSMPGWKDYVLYVNGVSKTFSMTGWRIGFLVVRGDIARKLAKLAVNIYSCAPSFAQEAAVDAFKGDWEPVRRMVEIFRRRRDIIYEELSRIKEFEVWKPHGAFYIFPRVSTVLAKGGLSDIEFVDLLLDKYYVVTIPGSGFPDTAGRDYIRLSYSVSEEDIREGVRRIADAVKEIMSS